MFAEKRTVIGDYFLMTDEGDQHTYFLFRRGGSGSITGPVRSIGWDREFILADDDGPPAHWAVVAIHPEGGPATEAAQGHKLIPRVRRTMTLRSPAEVWEHSRDSASWFKRPFY